MKRGFEKGHAKVNNVNTPQCIVCGTEVGPDAPRLGDRIYCPKHYVNLFTKRRGIWIAAMAGFGATVVFVIAAAIAALFIELPSKPLEAALVGLCFSAFPAVVWLGVFYRFDAHESSPKEKVLAVFLLGALFASGLGIPFLRIILPLGRWLSIDIPIAERWILAVLVGGVSTEFLKYLGIRTSVFRTKNFEQRADGIVYGGAVGLGFAFMLNLTYFLETRPSDPMAAAFTVAVESLAQASFAGITGYFMGRAKFEKQPLWWTAAGIALAAFFNGTFKIIVASFSRFGVDWSPLRGFAVQAVVAMAVFALLFILDDRAGKADFAAMKAQGPAEEGAPQ